MNINDRSVWLSYNVIGAVAQRPYDWGVGSAFHPMKIHILIMQAEMGYLVCQNLSYLTGHSAMRNTLKTSIVISLICKNKRWLKEANSTIETGK